MSDSLRNSPSLRSKLSTSALHKDKVHLPSRYAPDKAVAKASMSSVLSTIEARIKSGDQSKHSPSPPRILKRLPAEDAIDEGPTMEFKPKPLRREDSDFQNFKEIFLEPRQQMLDEIRKKGRLQPINPKQLSQEYQRLLQIEQASKLKGDDVTKEEVSIHVEQCLSLLGQEQGHEEFPAEEIFEEQIRIDPPEGSSTAVFDTVGPNKTSLAMVGLNRNEKGKVSQLLMRAKASMNTEDLEKQAHLSLYLGMVYEQQKKHFQALKFYRRFLGFAKAVKDKIGMALGANRVAVNYFYAGDIARSVLFHQQNLKLSDDENSFAGYYNLGICYRNLGQLKEALEFFQTALQWAYQHNETQSECLTLGQLAVTYRSMELYQEALAKFEESLEICRRIQRYKLLETNLSNILLIKAKFDLDATASLEQLAEEAYECSKTLRSRKSQEIASCNIGLIKGRIEFDKIFATVNEIDDIEHYDEN